MIINSMDLGEQLKEVVYYCKLNVLLMQVMETWYVMFFSLEDAVAHLNTSSGEILTIEK